MRVYRGVGPRGLKEMRPSEGGVHGPGVYFYDNPKDAKSYAGVGGGVIVAEVDPDDPDVFVSEPRPVKVVGTDFILRHHRIIVVRDLDKIKIINQEGFRAWLEAQNVFGFMQDEPEPDMDTMSQYPTRNAYAKAMSKRGRDTERAAEAITSASPGSWFVGEEELIELDNDAVIISAKGKRPERHIAIAHFKGQEPMPNGKHRFRILAFWQGEKEQLTEKELRDPIGGIVHIGGEIIDVWVHPDHRWNPKEPQYKLYRSLREWAKKRGIVGLTQGDDLTSKSFRASQAKYDWRRAHQ